MPKQYAKKELDSHYNQLPEVLKDAMFSADVAEKIYQIGERLGFTEIQISAMAEEAGYLILGVVEPKDFVSNLAERVGINEEAARSAARELNTQIFSPLREALKNAHPEKIGEAGSTPAQPPQPAPSQRTPPPPVQTPTISAPAQTAPRSAPSESSARPMPQPPSPAPTPRPTPPPPPPQPAPPPNIATQEATPVFNQSIDLRRKEIEEMEPPRPAYQPPQPAPSPSQVFAQGAKRPAQDSPKTWEGKPQQPIPPTQQTAPPQPLRPPMPPFISQGPPSKIPPIDLRNQTVPQPPHQGPHPLMTKPPVPPRAPGVDPYREPSN